jgi:predicted hydrocarbon binding protein
VSERTLSGHFLHHFVRALDRELGRETLSSVLAKAGLPSEWADPARWGPLDGTTAAGAYAGLQKALRTYYGRGARGFLIRVGNNLWHRLLGNAPLTLKAQASILRGLPVNARRKPALELLAKLMGDKRGDVTVHTLDLNLLLADHTSPGTLGQSEQGCICYVTLGLLRECLFWATEQEYDIEEISCRATGEEACEFQITFGG